MRKMWTGIAVFAVLCGAAVLWLVQPTDPAPPAEAEEPSAPAETAAVKEYKDFGLPPPMAAPATNAEAEVEPLAPLNCRSPAGAVFLIGKEAVEAAAFCAQLLAVAGAQPEPMTAKWREQAQLLRQQVIDTVLVRKALAEEGGAITDEQVDAALGERLAGLPKGSANQLDAPTTALVHQQLRARLELSKLLQLRGQGLVTDADLAAAYQADPGRFGKPGVASVLPYLLRVAKGAPEPEGAAARAKAEQFVAAVSKGEPAGTAAKAAGMHAMPKVEMSQGSGEEELVAAAMALSAGQWSAPVKTQVGWAVVQVLEKRPGVALPLEQVREQVQAFVEGKQRLLDRERALTDLRRATPVIDKVGF